MHYIIMCRSLTLAQKASGRLQNAGIFASVTKAPQSANPGGCTYGVKVGERNLTPALSVLQQSGIRYGKVFALWGDGSISEVTE